MSRAATSCHALLRRVARCCNVSRACAATHVATVLRRFASALMCPSQTVQRPGALVPYCVMIQSCCIAIRAGKWAVTHPASPLHVFFFICYTHCKTTIFFFSNFLVEPQKLIFFIFFIFFPVLHTIKQIEKKKISSIFFLFLQQPPCYF